MRLIRTKGSDKEGWNPHLCTRRDQSYAILSHRWLQDANHEILFADIEVIDEVTVDRGQSKPQITQIRNGQYTGIDLSTKKGYEKLRGAAQQALHDGYEYVWVDTCCIDKSSSAELSEAINSMFTWYSEADVCYAYLVDVNVSLTDDSLAQSQWWRRGWTLQELLAPQILIFFASDWTVIGEKKSMCNRISQITTIDPNIINGSIDLQFSCIAQRMSWMVDRVTTRIEDIAYCLLGIFNVNMPLLYGEGEKAFLRLQQEIMKDSDDESIFAWRDETINAWSCRGLLATRPSAFANSGHVVSIDSWSDERDRAPYTMTNKGLLITLPLTHIAENRFSAALLCADTTTGEKRIHIQLEKVSRTNDEYARVKCDRWATNRSVSGKLRRIFIKQVHDREEPVYEWLTDSESKLQLLRVVPDEEKSEMSVKLLQTDLTLAQYDALSYSRRSQQEQHTIRVNDRPIKVCASIYHFLRKMRQERRQGLFWVDSICAEESSQDETNQQHTFRGQVFAHAANVMLWFDDFDNIWSDTAVLKYLHFPSFDSLSAKEVGKLLLPLKRFAMNQYWNRSNVDRDTPAARNVVVSMANYDVTAASLLQVCDQALTQIEADKSLITDYLPQVYRLKRCLEILESKRALVPTG